jgi:chemotaxis signal transduction protein
MSDPASVASEVEVRFALGETIFAVAADSVIKVAPMPPLAQLPFQPMGLDGATAVANAIVPLLTLPASPREGRELILVRHGGHDYGLRADRVLRVTRPNAEETSAAAAQSLDIAALVAAIGPVEMPAPAILRSDAGSRTADPGEGPNLNEAPASQSSALAVETSGGICLLPLAGVVELFDNLSIISLPDSRPFLLGAAFYHDSLLPVLSLGSLQDPPAIEDGPSNAFVVIAAAKTVCVLAVKKIIGLRHDADPAKLLDLSDLLQNRLPASGVLETNVSPRETETRAAKRYLLIDYAGQSLAFPLDAVVHIHDWRPVLAVPSASGMRLAGVVALGSRILPVLDLATMFGLSDCRGDGQGLLELKLWRNEAFAVPVDHIRGMAAFADHELLRAPDGTAISALAKTGTRVVWMLDPTVIAEAAGWRLHAA